MSRAIDRRTIAVQSFFDRNPPEFSPTGLNSKLRGQFIAKKYKKLSNTYSPTAAKQILTKAGYKLGSNGVFSTPEGTPLKLTLEISTSSSFGDLVHAAQLVAQNLSDVGIPTSVKTVNNNTLKNDQALGNFQLVIKNYGASPSIYDLFNITFAQGSQLMAVGEKADNNVQRYRSSAAAKYLAQFAAAPPGSSLQAKALEGLEGLWVNEAPVVPLWRVSASGMWRTDRFTGWPSSKNPYAAGKPGDDTTELVPLHLTPVGR
jgi:peptide/nickel transport system substrate-binding protein